MGGRRPAAAFIAEDPKLVLANPYFRERHFRAQQAV
jgi:hypothetical protein